MWSGGPNPGGSSASRSEKTPLVSSESALTVIAKPPRSGVVGTLPQEEAKDCDQPPKAPDSCDADRRRDDHCAVHWARVITGPRRARRRRRGAIPRRL